MAILSTDAQSFDLVIDIDDDETQGEVKADCGCTLERTEVSVGFLFCDFHRSAPEMRERLLAEGVISKPRSARAQDDGEPEEI